MSKTIIVRGDPSKPIVHPLDPMASPPRFVGLRFVGDVEPTKAAFAERHYVSAEEQVDEMSVTKALRQGALLRVEPTAPAPAAKTATSSQKADK